MQELRTGLEPSYYFVQSSQAEELFEQLILIEEREQHALCQAPRIFDQSAQILLQNNALGEWLKVSLCQKLGISLGLKLRYSQEMLEHYLRFFVDLDETNKSWVYADLLSLAIYKILLQPPQAGKPLIPPSLASLLAKGTSSREEYLWDFAQQSSQLFLQYDRYRSQLGKTLNPQKGEDSWQQNLWAELHEDEAFLWRGELLEQILKDQPQPLSGRELPALVIIGSSFLSPSELQFYHYVSQFTPVLHFFLSPSYIPRSFLREGKLASNTLTESPVQNLQDWEQEQLPASLWLKSSLHNARQIAQFGGVTWLGWAKSQSQGHKNQLLEPPELIANAQQGSLLEYLQDRLSSVLTGEEELRLEDAPQQLFDLPKEDSKSIAFFACNDHWREVEVLKDQILELLASDSGLQLNEIAILAPDINQYQAIIQSILQDPSEDEQLQLPCNFIDLSNTQQSSYFTAFQSLLNLINSRFSLQDILSLLEQPCCALAPILQERSTSFWSKILQKLPVSWGFSAAHRRALAAADIREDGSELEAKEEATAEQASTRGTWAYAIEEASINYLHGLHFDLHQENREPAKYSQWGINELSAEELQALSDILEYILRLYQSLQNLDTQKKISQWVEVLENLQNDFLFCRNHQLYSDLRDQSFLNSSLRNLLALEESLSEDLENREPKLKNAHNSEGLPFHVIHSILMQNLEMRRAYLGRYLTQGITCSSLQPYRSVPFKVICVLGMNENDFPHKVQERPYDLCRSLEPGLFIKPQEQEYHLFAELLISARRKLYFFYRNRNPQKGNELSPSPLLQQICQFLAKGLSCKQEELWNRLHQSHPLHPFDYRYFQGAEGLFSYSQNFYTQMQCRQNALSQGRADAGARLYLTASENSAERPLPSSSDDVIALQLKELSDFLNDSPSYHWYHRSGLQEDAFQERWGDSFEDTRLQLSKENFEFPKKALNKIVKALFSQPESLAKLAHASPNELIHYLKTQHNLVAGLNYASAIKQFSQSIRETYQQCQDLVHKNCGSSLSELGEPFYLQAAAPFQQQEEFGPYICLPPLYHKCLEGQAFQVEMELGPLYKIEYGGKKRALSFTKLGYKNQFAQLFMLQAAFLSCYQDELGIEGLDICAISDDLEIVYQQYSAESGKQEVLAHSLEAYKLNLSKPLPLNSQLLPSFKMVAAKALESYQAYWPSAFEEWLAKNFDEGSAAQEYLQLSLLSNTQLSPAAQSSISYLLPLLKENLSRFPKVK